MDDAPLDLWTGPGSMRWPVVRRLWVSCVIGTTQMKDTSVTNKSMAYAAPAGDCRRRARNRGCRRRADAAKPESDSFACCGATGTPGNIGKARRRLAYAVKQYVFELTAACRAAGCRRPPPASRAFIDPPETSSDLRSRRQADERVELCFDELSQARPSPHRLRLRPQSRTKRRLIAPSSRASIADVMRRR